MTYKRCES